MAYKLINEKYCPFLDADRREFICDTDDDLENLPSSCVGSAAVSTATGTVFVVNASGAWVAFGEG